MVEPNQPFLIRLATTGDISRLCEFAEDFLTKTHARATGKGARQVFQHVITHDDKGIIYVAEHKVGLCAYAYASYQWRSEFGGETMDVVEIFVEQVWRNKGAAGSLMAALLENAKQRGIRRVSAEVHSGNAAIERMLESAGFDPEHRTVWGLQL